MVYAGSLALLSGALSVGVIIITSQTIDLGSTSRWEGFDLGLRHSKMMRHRFCACLSRGPSESSVLAV